MCILNYAIKHPSKQYQNFNILYTPLYKDVYCTLTLCLSYMPYMNLSLFSYWWNLDLDINKLQHYNCQDNQDNHYY